MLHLQLHTGRFFYGSSLKEVEILINLKQEQISKLKIFQIMTNLRMGHGFEK